MQQHHFGVVLLVLLPLVLLSSARPHNSPTYGNVPPGEYLLGMFNPEVQSNFAPVTAFGIIFQNNYVGYIRNETGKALSTMIAAFNRQYPNVCHVLQ
jgi:hypothetical protein